MLTFDQFITNVPDPIAVAIGSLGKQVAWVRPIIKVGAIAGLVIFIPLIGAPIAMFMPSLLALIQGVPLSSALLLLAFLTVFQQILLHLIVPRIMDRPEEARRTKAAIQIQSIEQALKLYKLDNGEYPSTEQGLQALIEAPSVGRLAKRWRMEGYLEKGRVPKDPWGFDFVYISPGLHGDFDLMSNGPDGAFKDYQLANLEADERTGFYLSKVVANTNA